MRKFTETELERMQDTQGSAMQDKCNILSYNTAGTPDAYGNPPEESTVQTAIACGVRLTSPREIQASGEVPVIDAMLRLPVDTTIDERDRIRITHRYGVLLGTAIDFTIEGPVLRGPSGIQLKLRKVDDGIDSSA